MFDFSLSDFYSLHTLLPAFGWAIASAMSIHGLHLASAHKKRSIIYASICGVAFLASLTDGAIQHRDNRQQDVEQTKQAQEIEDSKRIIQRIAVAQGIDPNESSNQLAEKVIKEQLGNEATQLSLEIFAFIGEIPPYISPKVETWKEDTDKMIAQGDLIRNQYDQRFLGRTLSIRRRLMKAFPDRFSDKDFMNEMRYSHAINTLGMREVAADLGDIGNTLLAEAK